MESEIWRYYGQEYMLYTEYKVVWNKLKRWRDVKLMGWYYDLKQGGKLVALQFIFPARLLKRVRRLAGIVPMKSKRQLEQAKKLGEYNKKNLMVGKHR